MPPHPWQYLSVTLTGLSRSNPSNPWLVKPFTGLSRSNSLHGCSEWGTHHQRVRQTKISTDITEYHSSFVFCCTDDRLDKLELSVQKLTASMDPKVAHHMENSLKMSSVTTDYRLQRLEAILTELTESIQTKQSSCSELREPDVRKRENQPTRSPTMNKKKRNYIPFDDSIITPDAFARFYTIWFNLEDKRKTNLYALRNEIALWWILSCQKCQKSEALDFSGSTCLS